jgi:hypothetical protein
MNLIYSCPYLPAFLRDLRRTIRGYEGAPVTDRLTVVRHCLRPFRPQMANSPGQADMMAIPIPGCAEYRDPGLWN